MPRKPRKKADPTPIGEVLESLPVTPLIQQATEDAAVVSFKKQREREQAVTDPAQSDALAAHLEARRLKAEIEPERPMPEPPVNDIRVADMPQPAEILGKHTAAERIRHPKMQPVPAGYFDFASDRQAGIRVCKSHDHKSVCLQFSDDRTPSRQEKDFLERVGAEPDGTEYIYRPAPKIWKRETPPGWTPGENTLDAERTMRTLATARNEGLAR